MAFQQTMYLFVLPSSPFMLFGFPQSLVLFAYFVFVFLGLLYLVRLLSPQQHTRVQHLLLPSVTFRVSKGSCSSVSLCQWSPSRAVRSLGLLCLTSFKESSLHSWSIAHTFRPTMGIWKGWIALWCLLSQGCLAAYRSSVPSSSSLR